MNKKLNKWKIVIKDLKNIRKLPLEIWKYILDISNIHYMPWKYSILENHVSIKIHLSTYVWRNVYNCVTKLYTVNVFTRYDEPYITFKENSNKKWLHIANKKMDKIVSNENMPEYIMTNVTNNQILFE